MCAHIIHLTGKDTIITIVVTFNELYHSKYKDCKYVSSYAVQIATLRKPYNYSLCVAVSLWNKNYIHLPIIKLFRSFTVSCDDFGQVNIVKKNIIFCSDQTHISANII